MKKLFPLHQPRKADARVLDAVKHDVRKYVQREIKKSPGGRGNPLEFSCRVGPSESEATSTPLKEISSAIDRAAATGGDHVFVEIKSAPRHSDPRG